MGQTIGMAETIDLDAGQTREYHFGVHPNCTDFASEVRDESVEQMNNKQGMNIRSPKAAIH